NGITSLLQSKRRQFAHDGFVLDEQDGLASFGVVGRRVADRDDLGSRLDLGKINLEGGAFAELALDVDMAGILADDAEAGCEAQAGSFARRFSGEEGFEEMRLYVFTHPGAGVGDRNHNPIPSSRVRVSSMLPLAHPHASSA